MIFPLTGFARHPRRMIRVIMIAKNYGINHYRFHNCHPRRRPLGYGHSRYIYGAGATILSTITDERIRTTTAGAGLSGQRRICYTKALRKSSFICYDVLGNELSSDKRLNDILKSRNMITGICIPRLQQFSVCSENIRE